jgi:hypothetical protein
MLIKAAFNLRVYSNANNIILLQYSSVITQTQSNKYVYIYRNDNRLVGRQ